MSEIEKITLEIDLMLSEYRAMCIRSALPNCNDLNWEDLEKMKNQINWHIKSLVQAVQCNHK